MSEISATLVKELREKSGVGMMECKKALLETKGDLAQAMDVLRKRGIAAAKDKAARVAKEGIVYAYIHPGSKLAVLVELNCETDFVARGVEFTELAKDVAMHICAQNPAYLSREHVPAEVLEKEKEILRAQIAETKKPQNILDKIVEGKINKFFEENCLLEQAFVKDDSKKVQDLIVEKIAQIKENIAIGRFVRYKVGEA